MSAKLERIGTQGRLQWSHGIVLGLTSRTIEGTGIGIAVHVDFTSSLGHGDAAGEDGAVGKWIWYGPDIRWLRIGALNESS